MDEWCSSCYARGTGVGRRGQRDISARMPLELAKSCCMGGTRRAAVAVGRVSWFSAQDELGKVGGRYEVGEGGSSFLVSWICS
jgi:hypothetical protein